MGGPNKLLLPFGNDTILEHTLRQLLVADVGPVIVVTGHQREAIATILTGYPVQEVYNTDFRTGMTSSIQAGVRAAEAQGYMICLSDMPMIPAAVYQLLKDQFLERLPTDERLIVMPRFGTQKGNPVLFSAAYREAILNHPEPEGCRGIVQTHAAHVWWVDVPEDGVVRDVDTPEDYQSFQPL
jgi:molybdenum cofactor cytidylyltransferase